MGARDQRVGDGAGARRDTVRSGRGTASHPRRRPRTFVLGRLARLCAALLVAAAAGAGAAELAATGPRTASVTSATTGGLARALARCERSDRAGPCVTASAHARLVSPKPGLQLSFDSAAGVASTPEAGEAGGSSCEHACHGVVAVTADAGRSWRVHSSGAVVPAALDFPTLSDGFLMGSPLTPSAQRNGAPCGAFLPCADVLATTDGGAHWLRVARSLPALWAIDFSSPSTGLAAVDTCRGARQASLRGGDVPFSPGGGDPDGVTALCAGLVERSTDAGRSWRPVLSTPAPVVALAQSGSTVLAVEVHGGGDGFVAGLRSTDGGVVWSAPARLGVDTPLLEMSVGISIASPEVAAVGWYDAIPQCSENLCATAPLYTTGDGGRSWSFMPPLRGATCPLMPGALDYRGDTLVALAQSIPTPACAPEDVELAASDDGGASWQIEARYLAGPEPGPLVLFPGGRGVAIDGDLLVTTDGGRHDTQVMPAPVPTGTVDFLSPRLGYGGGSAADPGAVLRTTDGGSRWRQVGDTGAVVSELDFTDPSHGWALVATPMYDDSSSYWVMTTSDGGRSWQDAAPLPLSGLGLPGQHGLFAQAPLSATSPRAASLLVPLAGGSPARSCPASGASTELALLSTTDGGRSWTKVTRVVPDVVTAAGEALSSGGSRAEVVGGAVPGCEAETRLLASSDGGRTWRAAASLPTLPAVSVPPSPYGVDLAGAGEVWLWVRGGQPASAPGVT
ncbi:MAG TPA: hypothetical protein VMD59_17610, partial [Acidimicrobiales bacterium]|nr:hypothetical protein [Acidimicrobiales bacterium]